MPVERVTIGKGITTHPWNRITGEMGPKEKKALAENIWNTVLQSMARAEEWARSVVPDWNPPRGMRPSGYVHQSREWYAAWILYFLRCAAWQRGEGREDRQSIDWKSAKLAAHHAAIDGCAAGFLYGQAVIKFEHEADALRGKAVKAGGCKGGERAKESPRSPYKPDVHAQWRAWAREHWGKIENGGKGHYTVAAALKRLKGIPVGVQQIARVIATERP